MSSFFEPATPVDGAREVRTPGTPVESPPEPAENSAMDSIYEFMSGLLGLGGAGGDGGRAAAARGEPLERSTTRMRDALLARNKSVKSGPRRQRRGDAAAAVPRVDQVRRLELARLELVHGPRRRGPARRAPRLKKGSAKRRRLPGRSGVGGYPSFAASARFARFRFGGSGAA